jgi:hypothetical protein
MYIDNINVSNQNVSRASLIKVVNQWAQQLRLYDNSLLVF